MNLVEFIQICVSLVLAGAAFIQVFFLQLAFRLASNYLGEHESKLKLEEERKTIREILDCLYKINNIYIQLFEMYNFEKDKDEEGNFPHLYEIAYDIINSYKSIQIQKSEESKLIHETLHKSFFIIEGKITNIKISFAKWKKTIKDIENDYNELEKILDECSGEYPLIRDGELSNLNKAIKKIPKNLNDRKNKKVEKYIFELLKTKEECIKMLG